MSLIEERLSDQFNQWEKRGRGWRVFSEPVHPEPPFSPFYGHFLPAALVIDDGRRPTFLSSFVERLSRKLSTQPAEATSPPEPEEEPEPQVLIRESLVELQTSLPAKLDIGKDAFEQFLRNLSFCREPVSFEMLGKAQGVGVQFAMNADDSSIVRRQLQAYFPEASFVPREGALFDAWEACSGEEILIVEFGLAREFMFSLECGKIDPFIGIIAALSELEQGELALFQVLFESVEQDWSESIVRSVTHADGKPFFVNMPELASAAEHKVGRPLYAAVVRIAVKSETFEAALRIARDLAGSLRVFAAPNGNELIPLSNDDYPFEAHIVDMLCRQSRRSGMLLNSDELIGFVHLPSSAVRSPTLERDSQRSKAAPAIVRNASGILLGTNEHAGQSVPVRLTPEQRVHHGHIIGASGTGKSTLLFNLIRQDIENGQGLAVFDPHGDLIDRILGVIPSNRINDVVLVDPSDEEYAVGFNILAAHSDLEKNLLASDLISVFQRLSTSWGDQLNSVLSNAILAFLESTRRGTIADMRRFLIEPGYRSEFLKSVQDSEVVYYWQKSFPQLVGNKSIGSVLTRLDGFLAQKPIRHMVSQEENRLDFAHIMDSGKIFLAKLPEGLLGKENSYLLGTVLVSKFQQLAMSRQAKQIAARRDFWIYCDEFHNFITPSMAQILAGARKYRIGLTLAHQELHQLERNREVESAVLSNPYTRVVFRVGDADAKKLAEGFSFFEARDVQNLETGQAICRVEKSAGDFNLTVPFPEPEDADVAAIRRAEVVTASREKYGRQRSDIEAMLRAKMEATTPETQKPKVPRVRETKIVPAAAEPPKPESTAVPPSPVPPAVVSPPEPSAEPPKAAAPDKGIGGHQHNLIRERIEGAAAKLGYAASREDSAGGAQKIDVVIANQNRKIACEIAITTTIDHEVGNVAKCVRAGFKHIALLSPSADRLEKIQTGVVASLSPDEAALVGYFHPDAFIAYLEEIARQDTAAAAPNSAPSTYGKYKIKRSVVKLTPEEIKEREAAALRMLAETMKKKKKE